MEILHSLMHPARLHTSCDLAQIRSPCDQAISCLIVSVLQTRSVLVTDATASVHRRRHAFVFVCMIIPIRSRLRCLRQYVLGEYIFVSYDRRLALALLRDLALLKVPQTLDSWRS